MFKLVALGILCVAAGGAQTISLGVLGGVPFTDVVSAQNSNNLAILPTSSNFIIGPALQINLPLHLRFEVDALYRPYSFSVTSFLPHVASQQHVSAADWQFPFLAQYRLNVPVVRPFLEGGLSFDRLSNISAAANNITSGPGQLVGQSHAAVVLGGGVDIKIPFVRVSGELRYSHQTSADFDQISKLNQAEFLLGVHF